MKTASAAPTVFFSLTAELHIAVYEEVARIDLTLYPRHGSHYKRHAFLHVSSKTREEFEPILHKSDDLTTATVRNHYGSLFTIDFALNALVEGLLRYPRIQFRVDFTVAVGMGQTYYTRESLMRFASGDFVTRVLEIAAAREGSEYPEWTKKKRARSLSARNLQTLTASLSL